MTRKKLIRLGILALLLAGAGFYGQHWWRVGRFLETTDNAYLQADMSVVAPKVAGYIRSIAVRDDQPVKAGDVLLTIDDTDYRARLDEATAALEAQQAALATIDSQLGLQRTLIDQAAAALDAAKAEKTRADLDLKRYRTLTGQDFATGQRLESSAADAAKAAAAVARAEAELAAEKARVEVLTAQRAEATAGIHRARAAFTLASQDLEDTVIRAPVDGVVGNRAAQLGQYVREGTQLLAVVPTAAVYVVANFKETQVAGIRPGQVVSLELDAFPGHPVTGRVVSFAPGTGAQFSLLPPENATGNFTKVVQRVPVRIEFDPAEVAALDLRPGLSVEVSVDTRADDGGTAVASR